MGLDMYLSADFYVGDWDHNDEDEKRRHKAILTACGLEGFRCNGAPALHVNVNVAYWRKDNQIHNWFVNNCQQGNDDCRQAYVSREHLEELTALCEAILADPSRAEELPTQAGCFFGSTEMGDDNYLAGLSDTVKQIRPILADKRFEHADFHYRSSW